MLRVHVVTFYVGLLFLTPSCGLHSSQLQWPQALSRIPRTRLLAKTKLNKRHDREKNEWDKKLESREEKNRIPVNEEDVILQRAFDRAIQEPRGRRSRIAVKVLELMLESSKPPGGQVVDTVVDLCLKDREWEHAVHTIEMLHRRNLTHATEISFSTFRAVIRQSSLAGKPAIASNVLRLMVRELSQHGLHATAQVNPSATRGYGRPSVPEKYTPVSSHKSPTTRRPRTPAWYLSEHLFVIVLNSCAEGGHLDVLEDTVSLMESARAYGVRKGPSTYSTLLKAYGRKGKLDKVKELLNDMPRSDVDVITLNSAVDALIRCGCLNEAEALVHGRNQCHLSDDDRGHHKYRVVPEANAASPLIQGNEREEYTEQQIDDKGKIGGPFRFVESDTQMYKTRNRCPFEFVEPDTQTYNTLIKGYGRAGDIMGAVLLGEEMALSARPSCLPDTITLNTLLDASIRAGDLDTAFNLIDFETTMYPAEEKASQGDFAKETIPLLTARMRSAWAAVCPRPVFASAEGYTAVVNGLCNAGRVQDAKRLILHMKHNRVPPTVVTYTALMGGYIGNGQMEEAWNIFRMLDAKPLLQERPTLVTYNMLIRGECQRGGFAAAKKLMSDMRRRGFTSDVATHNALIYGLVKARKLESAIEMLGRMDKFGPSPDPVTFALLIGGFGVEEKLSSAHSLLKRYLREIRSISQKKGRTYTADCVPFNAYLKACVHCGNLKQAVKLLQELANPSILENPFIEECPLLRSLEVEISPTDLAYVTPDIVSYSTVISALRASANPNAGGRALALYYDMRDTFEIEPDESLARIVLSTIVGSQGRGPHALCLDDVCGVLEDLEGLGWSTEVLDDLKNLVRGTFQAFSEYDSATLNMDANKQSQQATRKIFRTHDWNEVDSGFKLFF